MNVKEQIKKMAAIFGRPEVAGYTLFPDQGYYEVNLATKDTDPQTLGLPETIDNFPVKYIYAEIHVTTQWWQQQKFTELENRARVHDAPSIPIQEPTNFNLAIRTAQDPIYGGCEISQETFLGRWNFTLSCIVWDRTTHAPLLLSCAHGMCPNLFYENSSSTNFFPPEEVGTPIYQPRKPRRVGAFLRCGTHNDLANPVNIDAAVATIDPGVDYDPEDFGLAGNKGTYQAIDVAINDSVQYFGRSSGVQTGTVASLNYIFQPSGYPPVLTHRFQTIPPVVPGDSGSPVFRTSDGNFAGIVLGVALGFNLMLPATAIEADLNISFSPLPDLADSWLSTDEYTFTVVASGVYHDWQDEVTDSDEFAFEHIILYVFNHAQVQSDYFGYVRNWTDTQGATDVFTRVYVETWTDIQDQTQLFHYWPSISRTWQDTQTQTHAFVSSLQRLAFSSQQSQTDRWYAPGEVSLNHLQIQTQTDSFHGYSNQQQWSDNQIHYGTYDPSFPAKVRAWSDIQNQTERWDTTNFADVWQQTDQFQLGATQLTLNQTWAQSDTFRPPNRLTLSQTWTPLETWYTPVVNADLAQTWLQTDQFQSRFQSTNFNDTWVTTDSFQPLLHVVAFSNIQDQIDDLHSLTQSVHIDQIPYDFEDIAGFTVVIGMADTFEYLISAIVRDFKDTLNWFEQWSVVLPIEDLAATQTPTDEFEANPIWHDLQDTQSHQETWHQLSGHFYDDIFYQTSVFTREHHARLPWASTWLPTDTFSHFKKPPSCIIPYGLFTLIDSTEILPLRNARWGDTATDETQRVIGITRSGAPFIGRRTYWPQREVFKYTIRALSDEQLDQILNFLERNIGKQIWWIDHYGTRHRGFCQEPATPAIRRSKRRGSIELTLVDLGNPECTIQDHFLQQEEYAWQL